MSHGAIIGFPGYSGIVSDGTILDLSGGASNAVSFYYLGAGVGQIEAFDEFGGLGNSLGVGDVLPAMGILSPAGMAYPGLTARSLVFTLTGEIAIEQLTYGDLVVAEPGTWVAVSGGLLLAGMRSRARRHL